MHVPRLRGMAGCIIHLFAEAKASTGTSKRTKEIVKKGTNKRKGMIEQTQSRANEQIVKTQRRGSEKPYELTTI